MTRPPQRPPPLRSPTAWGHRPVNLPPPPAFTTMATWHEAGSRILEAARDAATCSRYGETLNPVRGTRACACTTHSFLHASSLSQAWTRPTHPPAEAGHRDCFAHCGAWHPAPRALRVRAVHEAPDPSQQKADNTLHELSAQLARHRGTAGPSVVLPPKSPVSSLRKPDNPPTPHPPEAVLSLSPDEELGPRAPCPVPALGCAVASEGPAPPPPPHL